MAQVLVLNATSDGNKSNLNSNGILKCQRVSRVDELIVI